MSSTPPTPPSSRGKHGIQYTKDESNAILRELAKDRTDDAILRLKGLVPSLLHRKNEHIRTKYSRLISQQEKHKNNIIAVRKELERYYL